MNTACSPRLIQRFALKLRYFHSACYLIYQSMLKKCGLHFAMEKVVLNSVALWFCYLVCENLFRFAKFMTGLANIIAYACLNLAFMCYMHLIIMVRGPLQEQWRES